MKSTKQDARQIKAALRFLVLSLIKAKTLAGKTISDAIKKTVEECDEGKHGPAFQVSIRSIYRWLKSHKSDGFQGLFDKMRKKCSSSLVLKEDFLSFLKEEKTKDPKASIPEIIRRAVVDEIIPSSDSLSRVTVYRAAIRMNLPIHEERTPPKGDKRPFCFKHRMQMVMCDGKHFKVGPSSLRRVVLIYIDDATRFGLHAEVGTTETADLFLRGLFGVIMKHGFMTCLYVDNGSGFKDTFQIAASLNIHLIHGTAGYPEGRGKIERFNQTLIRDLLRSFDGNPSIDPRPEALNLIINHYLEKSYNTRSHEGIDGVPFEKFENDPRSLRYAESEEKLRQAFVVSERRRVKDHNVVSLDSVFYELPLGYAGKIIDVYREILTGDYWILHDDRYLKLHKSDPAFNAHNRNYQHLSENNEHKNAIIETAAFRDFKKSYSPITLPDGGFVDKEQGHD